MKVCVGGLLIQRDITKDKLGERDGEIEGHLGTLVWVLLAEPGVKMCWLSAHLWSCACKTLCVQAVQQSQVLE